MTETEAANAYPRTERSRARRLPQRASYDRAAVHAILDSSLLCHVGYVLSGRPFVTPTAFWRNGDTLFWHGSAASRMIESVDGAEVCVTVSHLDGLVLARSAFHHSVEYRSAMMFGRARVIADLEAKRVAMRAFVERLYPGRSADIRESSDNELKAIALVAMEIEEAVAKVRADGVIDEPADYALPAWAGVIPLTATAGAPRADARLDRAIPLPRYVTGYIGRPVDAVFKANAARQQEGPP